MSSRHYIEMYSSRDLAGGDDSEKSDVDSALEEGISLIDLKEQLAQVQKDKALLEVELSKWERKSEKVKGEIQAKEAEEHLLQEKIEFDSSKSQAPDGDDENPPGPDSLEWVDGACFNFFSMFVVFANVTIMVLKHFWDPMTEISGELWYFDQAFLIFYIIELSLRFALWRDQLLFGRPCSKTWVTSIIEQWILPLFMDISGGGFGFLRILRIFRFVRVLRIVGKINLIDLAENDWFLAFMMAVIGLNCIVMGIQEDFPKWGCWIYFENFFLGLFFFELVIKLNHFGSSFFCNDQWVYNWLDFVIVVGGCLDTWFLPIFNFFASEAGQPEEGSKALGTLAAACGRDMMLRLVRLLRLIRLVRGIPQLYNLLKGIIEAMQGMLWLLVLTTAVIYIIALVVMMLWGKDGLVTADDSQEIRDVFPSVGKAPRFPPTLLLVAEIDPAPGLEGASTPSDKSCWVTAVTASEHCLSHQVMAGDPTAEEERAPQLTAEQAQELVQNMIDWALETYSLINEEQPQELMDRRDMVLQQLEDSREKVLPLLQILEDLGHCDTERPVMTSKQVSCIWGSLASFILNREFEEATDGAERAADVIFKINDFLDTTMLEEIKMQNHWQNLRISPQYLMGLHQLRRESGSKAAGFLLEREELVLHLPLVYSDPVTRFLLALYDFDEAQLELQKCEKVCKVDYFLSRHWAEFQENARLLIFETYCRIHQCINIGMIAHKLNMEAEEAEVKLIQNAKLDARIDSEKSRVVMSKAPPSVYQQVIEKTKNLSFRSKTMWTLFMAMNGDPGGMQPLFDAYPGTLVFAAGYMIFTSFAILSVLTGVVADKMATAAEEHTKEIEEESQRKQDMHTSKYLERIYTAYSENGSGGITQKTYKAMLDDEDVAKELCEILNMEMPELEDAWEGLKKEPRRNMIGAHQEVVNEDNFKDGLMKAHGAVENLSITRVYQKLRTIEKKLEGRH
eukprot:s779_g16.t1